MNGHEKPNSRCRCTQIPEATHAVILAKWSWRADVGRHWAQAYTTGIHGLFELVTIHMQMRYAIAYKYYWTSITVQWYSIDRKWGLGLCSKASTKTQEAQPNIVPVQTGYATSGKTDWQFSKSTQKSFLRKWQCSGFKGAKTFTRFHRDKWQTTGAAWCWTVKMVFLSFRYLNEMMSVAVESLDTTFLHPSNLFCGIFVDIMPSSPNLHPI